MLNNTSREKLFAIPGASIELIRERLTPAFSANFSCDKPRIFLSVEITIPNWINLSRFLNSMLLPTYASLLSE